MLLTEHAVESFDGSDSHEGHGHHRYLEGDHNHEESDDHEDHVDVDVPVAWRFGASILGGFLLPSPLQPCTTNLPRRLQITFY